MESTPNPVPVPAPAVAAAVPAPAPTAPAFRAAPGGLTCKICNAPLKYATEGQATQEYVCSTLKDESPILADKYEEWRNHWVASRVVQAK